MSMIMRSPGSQSLAHELLASILSHLPSHRLQLPWEEIMIASLGRLLHFLFLLRPRVIFLHGFVFLFFRHFSSSFD
jgi:hypothetical protein